MSVVATRNTTGMVRHKVYRKNKTHYSELVSDTTYCLVCLYRVMDKAIAIANTLYKQTIPYSARYTGQLYPGKHIPSNKVYEIVYKPYSTLTTVYQAMLHLSLHSPDSKRRRRTFVETENLRGDGGSSL